MKKVWSILLVAVLLFTVFPVEALAAQADASFRFELTVDGLSEKEVKPGDIITVVLNLYRTGAEEDYTMYAMQDEICYDSNFFELVENGELLAEGIQSADIAMRDHFREFYMNYLSFGGGDIWAAKKTIGSFQLKVIGTSGVTKITNEDYLVSLKDGSGSYPCKASDLTVIVSSECTIRFVSKGGTPVEDVSVVYGDKIPKPADPERDGKNFAGWYADIDCIQEWNFDSDTVAGNMTLYAKWSDAPTEDGNTDPTGNDNDNDNDTDIKNNYGWLWFALPVLILLAVVLVLKKKKK